MSTGQDFDMSPERFTLDNMFSMELHKYQEVAEEIVNHAIKVKFKLTGTNTQKLIFIYILPDTL